MGFVQLSDNLSSWAWINEPKTVYIYVRLLLGAAWTETDYQNIHLQRGQIAISQREFAEKCGVTYQELRTILKRLISTQKITQSTTHKISVITMLEYDLTSWSTQSSTTYQRINNAIITQSQRDTNAASLYNTNNHNIKQPNNALTREGGGLDNSFEKFWREYPKKTAKQQALKAWEKLNPGEELTAKILASLERQKKSVQWTKDNGQYIPYPATWINGKRWEDELTQIQEVTANGKHSADIEQRTMAEWLAGFE